MKRLLMVFAMLCSLFVAIPASAHHMAEGIVSDEVYEMITSLLEEADSPHLTMDLSIMPSMAVITVTVPTGMVDDILEGIDSINHGLWVNVSDEQAGGWVTIVIAERIGAGESQVVTVPEP